MGFLRKMFGASESTASTFRARVDAFWEWFAEHEQDIYDELQARTLDGKALAAAIHEAAPSLAWELCPSPEDGKEGFALSGEGITSRRLLVNYMVGRAPALERWTLFCSKQAQEDIAEAEVDIGTGGGFAFADFHFGLDFDAEDEVLHISVNHPRFAEVPEEARTQLTFLALDNALGENFVEAWCGPIERTPERTPDQKFGIDELRRQARAAVAFHDLDPDLDPIDRWATYQTDDVQDGDVVPRGDVFIGSTCNVDLIRNARDPNAEDGLEGSGACYAYVMFPTSDLTAKREIDERAVVEQLLDERLRAAGAGGMIGGAMGQQYAYIDLILFDEPAAVDIIKTAMPTVKFVTQASLRFFAPKRRDEHVALLTA